MPVYINLNVIVIYLYNGKTNRNFTTSYGEHISEMKLKKPSPNANFANYVLENNHLILMLI